MIATQLRILGVAPCGLLPGEIAVDLFAGAGGWAEGFRRAARCSPAVNINHDAHAIRCHHLNHPDGDHYCEDVNDVDPHRACRGRRVGWLHLSPDCTHHSRAKGGKPRDAGIRALAWVGVKWAAAVAPRILSLENVPEFVSWGPLLANGKPDPARKGETFRELVSQLRALGYVVEWRNLVAADYGTPTTRRRLFLIARRDGLPIRWPAATHGPGLEPVLTAASCIDWSIPCPSIFLTREEGRKLGVRRPLAPNSLRRIAAGVMRYVVNGRPFIVTCNHAGAGFRGQSVDAPMRTVTASRDAHGLVAASMIRLGHGEKQWSGVDEPVQTVRAQGQHHALVAAFLAKHNGGDIGAIGQDVDGPMHTVTGVNSKAVIAAHLITMNGEDGHRPRAADLDDPLRTVVAGAPRHGLVAAFMTQYFSNGGEIAAAGDPLHAITARARHGLVTCSIDGDTYAIGDLGMRMLRPRELARAQGFPDSYVIDGTQTEQIARIGNSVCPPVAEALVRANLGAEC